MPLHGHHYRCENNIHTARFGDSCAIASDGGQLLGPQKDQQYPAIYQKIAAMNQRIVAYAKSAGGAEEFTYLNYADMIQNPIGSYDAANINHIRKTAAKYDTHAFFQQMVPGGFKIDPVA